MDKITKNNFRPNVEYDENFKPINKREYQPWLNLNKEQMADPFGWLQSQGSINVRAILKSMKYDDRVIDCLINNKCPKPEMQQSFEKQRQNIGQKAIQEYQKWALLHEGKKPIKINESQLRKIIAESVRRVLKEEYDMPEFTNYPEMFTEMFTVYTHNYPDSPCFVEYMGKLYGIPQEYWGMLQDLNDIDGRKEFLNAIKSGKFPESCIQVISLIGHGFKERHFNANAY